MARYGIVAPRALGVPVGTLLQLAKRLGKDHALATALWNTGWYEARMLAAMVEDPRALTRRQMDAWATAFDNWAICDTACFHLFDRTPLGWERVRTWSTSRQEFVKRAGYALIASLALHDKTAPDSRFLALLPLIEKGARDERNFVKKGVSWALRSVGRRSPMLRAAALESARRLAAADEGACRWVGKDALRDLGRESRPRTARGGL
jgi:3-methyladenine DNA glycosylase AlkD